MKHIGTTLIIMLFFGALSCNEEDEGISDKVQIRTVEVTNITDKGVDFVGNFNNSEIDNIENHGFVWSKNESISTSSSFIINLGKPSKNVFTASIGYQLEAGEYFVRAFVTTSDKLTYYGQKIKFISFGSEGPQLIDVSPSTLKFCDTLIVKGRNFIEKINPEIKINNKKIQEFIFDPRNNKIKVLVNNILPEKNTIDVKFNEYNARKEFTISQSKLSISMLTPQLLNPGDTLKFQFSELPVCLISKIRVYPVEPCNNCGVPSIDLQSKQVKYLLSKSCLPSEASFEIAIADSVVFTSPKLSIQLSKITSISPDKAKLGSTVTINGKFPELSLNSIALFLNYQGVNLDLVTTDKIEFQLPEWIEIPNDGRFKGMLVTCNSITEFNLDVALPKIFSISSSELPIESQVITISGENLYPGNINLSLCNETAVGNIIEQSQSEIKFQISNPFYYLCSESVLKLTLNGYAVESKDLIKSNITAPFKQLASFPGGTRSFTASFSIGNFGYVGMGYNDNIFYDDLWMFNVQNNTWVRKADFPGRTRNEPAVFVIGNDAYVGLGFDENYNPVSEIWKYSAITNVWTRIPDFPGIGLSRTISFTIDSKGYVGRASFDRTNLEFWQYSPTENNWTQKSDLPVSIDIFYYRPYFSAASHGYYVAGDFLNKYDPVSDNWIQQLPCSFPSAPGATYVQNNLVYVFSSDYTAGYDLNNEVCESILNVNYTQFFKYGVASFIINGKGYFGSGEGTDSFWELDFSNLR